MQRLKTYNAILSVLILLCLVVGWTKPFNFETNVLIYNRLLYLLIGISFFIQTRLFQIQKMIYPMYVAIACCIIGAFLPLESKFSAIKTIGLFTGIIISIFNRRKA